MIKNIENTQQSILAFEEERDEIVYEWDNFDVFLASGVDRLKLFFDDTGNEIADLERSRIR